jgi:hypothetical protein
VWEPGDEWVDRDSQIGSDVMFRTIPWIEAQLERVLRQHQVSVGYSTCFWHNVRLVLVLFDRYVWYLRLQQLAQQPYPEPLQHAIIAKNYPILRHRQSSYLHQLERALARKDLVSLNHRVAALLASYFDILFAVNRLPHPGEKRLAQLASEQCRHVLPGMTEQVQQIIQTSATGDAAVLNHTNALLDGLDDVLRQAELLAVAKAAATGTTTHAAER